MNIRLRVPFMTVTFTDDECFVQNGNIDDIVEFNAKMQAMHDAISFTIPNGVYTVNRVFNETGFVEYELIRVD